MKPPPQRKSNNTSRDFPSGVQSEIRTKNPIFLSQPFISRIWTMGYADAWSGFVTVALSKPRRERALTPVSTWPADPTYDTRTWWDSPNPVAKSNDFKKRSRTEIEVFFYNSDFCKFGQSYTAAQNCLSPPPRIPPQKVAGEGGKRRRKEEGFFRDISPLDLIPASPPPSLFLFPPPPSPFHYAGNRRAEKEGNQSVRPRRWEKNSF